METALFPFADYWWFYLGFTIFVLFMLALDLGVFHRQAHAVSVKEAASWTAVWVTLAMLFGIGFYYYSASKFGADVAWTLALEYFAGYVVEESLSVDNIFVFVMVFAYFKIPAKYQHRVLFYGILGALILRAIFIGAGSWLMQFHWVIYIFGGFLIFSGIKLIFAGESDIEPDKNIIVRIVRRFIPVTHEIEGKHFFVRKAGRLFATPLFLALMILEFTDVIFALDSVPAIFGLTKEPLIVFTSNIFAILGLRSLYFMLAGAMDRFHLLQHGLSVILVFVGLKMVYLDYAFGGKFPITWSLAFIGGILLLSIVGSLIFVKKNEEELNRFKDKLQHLTDEPWE
jgi:tellurite resistance protein TerC